MLQDQRRLRRTTTLVTIYMGSLLALAATAMPVASEGDQAMRFGMDISAIDAQTNAGIAPDLAMFWIGPWTLTHGWGGPDTWLDTTAAKGVTPVIQFYYWGDDISKSCIENGCWSDLHGAWKDKAGWQELAKQLANHLNARLAGKPAIIVLETEFNKNGVTTYEPLDAYLESKANYFHTNYPAAEVVLGLGNWGRADWHTWDRAAAASDAIGLQGLRGSTRDSLSSYLGLFDATLAGAKKAQSLFGKPVVLSDIALSSYPEPDYANHQATVIKEFVDRLDELEATGVNALVYRGLRDDPHFDTNNYYGEAERHWGLRRADGTNKPAWAIWRDGVQAARAAGSSTTPTDGPIEAESFQTKTTGGVEGDTSASGGQRWNLWSNGNIANAVSFASAGTYALAVTAKGSEAAGVAPHMVVKLDGVTVLTADPPAGSWQSYTASVDVASAGTRTLKIVFTNDAWIGGEDRNLLLDKLDVQLVAPPNSPPSAAFGHAASERTVSVDASSSSDADGDALSYAWTWGDGTTGTGVSASHTYAADGTYTITLTVSDGEAEASASRGVSVVGPPPSVAVRDDGPTLVEGEAFPTKTTGGLQSDAAASGGTAWNLWANGHIAQALSFDTPGEYELAVTARGTSAAGVPPHMVVSLAGAPLFEADPVAGSYATYRGTVVIDVPTTAELRLAFTNDAWIDGEDRNLILDKLELAPLANAPPEASFTASASELTASVDASSSSDADGDALTYAWAWGDGSTGAGLTASHTYAAEGTYTITLTVSDGEDTASTTRSLTVTAPAPTGAPMASDGPTRLEVESFETRTTGGLHFDAAASDGKAWNLWANGRVAQLLSFDGPGTYELTVHSQGDELGGVAPHMLVRFGGTIVLEADPPEGGYQAYTTTVEVAAAGTYELRIVFTNDEASETEDRNLILDAVELAPHTPDPILSLLASPFKRQGINHIKLEWSGATTTAVDVYVDGARFSTTPNDGRQSYNLGTRGSVIHAFHVCEAGTSVCSAEVAVTY